MENNSKNWKTLESRYVWQRPWLTARCDKVQLPTGAIHDEYYVLEYPTWVNIIARRKDGLYVMVEQYRHGLGQTLLELCAGCVEDGEDPLDAARRELAEETGHTGGEWTQLMVLSPNPSANNNLNYCYFADGVEPTQSQHLDATEDISVYLLTEDELLQLMRDDRMKQALMAAPLWKYFALGLNRK